jgi:hypothetical protein
MNSPPEVITKLPLIEELFTEAGPVFGDDLAGYRGHVYRVYNLCRALAQSMEPSPPGPRAAAERDRKIAVAAYFHDAGIWTADTFDYISPSVILAHGYLAEQGLECWEVELELMIRRHHKLTHIRDPAHGLVEAFRRADAVDLTLGLLRFGLDRRYVRAVRSALPNAGFHMTLTRLSLKRLASHPIDPLPMFEW